MDVSLKTNLTVQNFANRSFCLVPRPILADFESDWNYHFSRTPFPASSASTLNVPHSVLFFDGSCSRFFCSLHLRRLGTRQQKFNELWLPYCLNKLQQLGNWACMAPSMQWAQSPVLTYDIQGLYPFSETNFHDFSRTQIDFSRALKFTLTPTLPRSQC